MEVKTQQNPNSKKNSNVIYFLIAVMVALLGTDVYLYMQKKQEVHSITTRTEDEKSRLKTELDSLEVQLETQVQEASTSKTKMTAAMRARTDSLQAKIRSLRVQLAKGKLTAQDLRSAQEDIKQLRYFVTKYTADIEDLKRQKATLTEENDTLKSNLAVVATKATTLQKQNEELTTKVKVASALKVAGAEVTAYKIKGNGKETDVTKARTAKKLKINFTVAANAIAEKGLHDIYIRIVDPTGNLITGTDAGTFNADGQDLQSTYKTAIDFKDDGATYTIDWVNPSEFQKGAYTIILYADGYTMGKTTLTLK
jgi:prefoldin subunit 5